jgi:hypothetical protein
VSVSERKRVTSYKVLESAANENARSQSTLRSQSRSQSKSRSSVRRSGSDIW